MKLLITFLAIILLPFHKITWETNVENALQNIKNTDKTVLLYFSGSDWCKPCIQLKTDVFETALFADYANEKLELVNIDFKRDQSDTSKTIITYNESIAERYNPKGYFPFVVVLDSSGTILKQIDGFKGETADYYIKHYLQ
ncbi:MAG: thioredoxin family protein [Flavobacteriaceae bacterium]|nr:thioredoxin family protein [Flavobacteriaceae bacterium]